MNTALGLTLPAQPGETKPGTKLRTSDPPPRRLREGEGLTPRS
jgi:hypothetical protein